MSDSREPRKRKPSDKITSLDNVDKDAVKKRRLLEAHRSRQASVEDEEDDNRESDFTSLRPKNPRNILESDDEDDEGDDVVMFDRDPSQPSTSRATSNDKDVDEQVDEEGVPAAMTDEQELGKMVIF